MKNKMTQTINKAIKEYRKFNKRKYPKHYLLFLLLINKLKFMFKYDKFNNIDIFFSKEYVLVLLRPYDIRIFIDYKYIFTIMISTRYTDGTTKAELFDHKDFKDNFNNKLLNDIEKNLIIKGE